MGVHRKVAVALALALLMAAVVSSSASSAPANTAPGWNVGTLTDAELRALIGQMTLAEEVAMIHGAPEGANCNSNPANGPIFPVDQPLGAGLRRPGGLQQRRGAAGHPAAAADRRPGGRPPGPRRDRDAGAGRPGRDVRPRRGAGATARRVGRAGRATNQDVWLGADDQPGQLPDRRAQLRDARRGPVPGRRAGRARGEGRPGRGPDRRAQALHRERLRERPHLDQRQDRRPDAARDRAAGASRRASTPAPAR